MRSFTREVVRLRKAVLASIRAQFGSDSYLRQNLAKLARQLIKRIGLGEEVNSRV